MIASGTLIQNTARQSMYCVMRPPSTGPSAAKNADAPAMSPSARPRSSSGKTNATIAIVVGIMRAAPTPWETRMVMRKPIVGASAGQGGGDAEQPRTGEEHLPQPQLVADPTAEDHERRQRQHVGGEDPLTALQRRAEAGDRIGRREGHRGLVDEDHAVGDRHRHQREPLRPATHARIFAYPRGSPGGPD